MLLAIPMVLTSSHNETKIIIPYMCMSKTLSIHAYSQIGTRREKETKKQRNSTKQENHLILPDGVRVVLMNAARRSAVADEKFKRKCTSIPAAKL